MQADDNYHWCFNRLYPTLPVSAYFKQQPEDFIVEEHIAFELGGEGEHCWLYIQKRLLNTDDVAQKLAKFAGVKKMAVGYAGLKDKYAVSSQWFSVQLPGKEAPDWRQLESEQLQVLHSTRHSRKLQRGALSHNTFRIRLREVTATQQLDAFALLDERCLAICQSGVPNYFGRQRFGRGMNNLNAAQQMFQSQIAEQDNDRGGGKRKRQKRVSRHQRSLYLSAARSWLFNHILSHRIQQQNWNQRIAGDVFMLDAKSGCFSDDATEALNQRLAQFEIHPTGVLWGDGDTLSRCDCQQLEQQIVDRFPVFRDGLLAARVAARRRALRLLPVDFGAQREGSDCILAFQLPPGAYATVVLDELLTLRDT